MKKISLAVLAFFFHILGTSAQNDTSAYKSRKLKLEEVNFISAYYSQDGNNSAVTGGIGTEKLADYANTVELKMVKTGPNGKIQNYLLALGIDYYTSASSDKIDPSTISSASSHDGHFYPSLTWTEKDTKNNTLGFTGSCSVESDYTSTGIGAHYSKSSKDNNREFAVHLQSYFDWWKVIYPVELRPPNGRFSGHDGPANVHKPRDSYSASFSFSQIINTRLQLSVLLDLIEQRGLLATDYQRVYFTDSSERIEKLPGKRFKLPIGLRVNYFLGDRYILRGYYRYYQDDWGIDAHTANLEVAIKINPFISLSPFYRYYIQTAADYFAPYRANSPEQSFYTSDYDLSAFASHFFGSGIRLTPVKGILGIAHWNMMEIRYGHYLRTTGLHSNIITLNAQFK